jgi:hypothetical protein
LVKFNALLPQKLSLNFVPVSGLQGYLTVTLDHPVPGELVLAGAGMQHPNHLSGTTGIACQGSHLSVGGHSSPRDSLNHVDYSLGKRIAIGYLMLSVFHTLRLHVYPAAFFYQAVSLTEFYELAYSVKDRCCR